MRNTERIVSSTKAIIEIGYILSDLGVWPFPHYHSQNIKTWPDETNSDDFLPFHWLKKHNILKNLKLHRVGDVAQW